MLTYIFIYMNAGSSCYAYVFRIIHIYTLKIKISWEYTYPQALQGCLFLHGNRFKYLFQMDPLQWMGAVRMRVQNIIRII